MDTPVHASVEDITSYGNACGFFTLQQKFLMTVTGAGGWSLHKNPLTDLHQNLY